MYLPLLLNKHRPLDMKPLMLPYTVTQTKRSNIYFYTIAQMKIANAWHPKINHKIKKNTPGNDVLIMVFTVVRNLSLYKYSE